MLYIGKLNKMQEIQEASVIIRVRESELNSIVETMKILKGISSLATDSKLLDDLKKIRNGFKKKDNTEYEIIDTKERKVRCVGCEDD
tara:strand:+ start:8020 stop:8280 length:261 start_codon:yes stop_codon:yes gene_type:complete